MWYTVLLLANVCRVKSSSFLTVSDFGHCTAHEIMPDGCMIGRRPWQRLPPLGMIARGPAGAACRVGSSRVCVRPSLCNAGLCQREEDLSIERVWGQSCDGRVCLFAPCLCVLSGSSLRGRTSHRSNYNCRKMIIPLSLSGRAGCNLSCVSWAELVMISHGWSLAAVLCGLPGLPLKTGRRFLMDKTRQSTILW
jgi:hypothetical protein